MLSTAYIYKALSLLTEIIKHTKILEQFLESSEASKILTTNSSIIYLGKMREFTKVQKKWKMGKFSLLFFPWVWERERWKGRESKWPVVVQAGGQKKAYKLGGRNLTGAQRGKKQDLKKKKYTDFS